MKRRSLVGWFGFWLTVLKPIFTLVVIVWILQDHKQWAGAGIFFIMIADIFDGVIFRSSVLVHREDLGWMRRKIDIIGDRVAIHGVILAAIFAVDFPVRFYLIEILREAILLAIVVRGWIVERPIKKPNLPSRIAAFMVGLSTIAYLFDWLWLMTAFGAFLIIFGTIGSFRYYQTIRSP